MKKINIFLLTAVIGLLLVGCGEKEEKATVVEAPPVEEVKEEPKEEVVIGSILDGKYVVDATYLIDKIKDENVIIIDARGADTAKEGTVEGAVAFKWQAISNVANGKSGDALWGTLMAATDLATSLGNLGIDKTKEIIVFGDGGKGFGDEGRMVWSLNIAGYENVKLVNSGFDSIVIAGVPTVKGASVLEPITVEIAQLNDSSIIHTEELKGKYDTFKIIDVRSVEEYKGSTNFGEAKGGHLPGAINIPFTSFFNEDNSLKTKEELEKLFLDAGISKEEKVVAYCTVGIRSAYAVLLLEMLGFENPLNYSESYYRWAASEEVEL